jgi:transcriptional regulator with XRE-family HTH domain
VEPSRIAANLRAARQRLGWSRETLAYHSGVSWAAITQIESGRRKDVRLTSLSALADALRVSVDYLIGSAAATTRQLFEHRILAYGSEEEFIAAAIPFLNDGIEQSNCLLAIVTEAKIGILRDALGDRSELVEFAIWTDWYRSPQEALRRYDEFVKARVATGAVWIRILAEAAWANSTNAEIAAWTRYESLVNLAFASSPATIMCTYDTRSLPNQFVDDAHTTHPALVCGTSATTSPNYREPLHFLLDAR